MGTGMRVGAWVQFGAKVCSSRRPGGHSRRWWSALLRPGPTLRFVPGLVRAFAALACPPTRPLNRCPTSLRSSGPESLRPVRCATTLVAALLGRPLRPRPYGTRSPVAPDAPSAEPGAGAPFDPSILTCATRGTYRDRSGCGARRWIARRRRILRPPPARGCVAAGGSRGRPSRTARGRMVVRPFGGSRCGAGVPIRAARSRPRVLWPPGNSRDAHGPALIDFLVDLIQGQGSCGLTTAMKPSGSCRLIMRLCTASLRNHVPGRRGK
jgi:hypothetical protein